ncbi:MAG: RnfABCDGE type electron transport complex subunit G [Candidatus Omnitrophota bacterium]|nr:RnfABCDGE type electron transport complex subunit G [Candidatus Omnitrophota bacterium]
MKEIIKYSLILSAICLVASGLLVGVYSLTKPRIASQGQAEIQTSLKQVLADAVRFEPIKEKEEIVYYKGYDNKNKIVGVAFNASAKGYSSIIETMVGISLEGEIIAIKVINQNETPGLGARIAEKSFTSQFIKKSVTELSKVNVISGATISSKAVIESVKRKAEEIKKLLK